MTELEKAAQKNGPEVELCEQMQRAQARGRLLKPDDLGAPELDLSDSHTLLFALAEYWKRKHDKLKALTQRPDTLTQALTTTEPVQDVTPTSGNILVDAFNEVQALKQQPATPEPAHIQEKPGEREKAVADAAIYGTGYLVNGYRVNPAHVAVVTTEHKWEPSIPVGWVACRIEHEPGYPEDVAYGPPQMMDRLKKWLDKHFANLAKQQDATHTSPQVPEGFALVPLQVLKDASDALGNFVSDHGWGDADMQAMDNLDAYIARREAIDAARKEPGHG